jgi:hypothetical protein
MATVAVPIDTQSYRVFSTLVPEYVVVNGANFPSDGPAFPQNTAAKAYYKIGAELYGSGNWTLKLEWYSRSGSTSGTVTWSVQMAAITPGDAVSVEGKSFATATAASATTVNSTAKGLTETTLTISTNLDSVAAGDTVWLAVTRTDANMTGDAILVRMSLSYSDT